VAVGYGDAAFAHRPTDNILHYLLIGINESLNKIKKVIVSILSPFCLHSVPELETEWRQKETFSGPNNLNDFEHLYFFHFVGRMYE